MPTHVLQINTGNGWHRLSSERHGGNEGAVTLAIVTLKRKADAWAMNYPQFRNAKFRVIEEGDPRP